MADTYLPTDISSDLLDGWSGPVQVRLFEDSWQLASLSLRDPEGDLWVTTQRGSHIRLKGYHELRLNLARPEVRDHLVRWAAAREVDLSWARDLPEALAWAVRRVVAGEPVTGASTAVASKDRSLIVPVDFMRHP